MSRQRRHPGGVGLLEERLDLVFVLDVRLGMRVVDQLQAEPVSARSAIRWVASISRFQPSSSSRDWAWWALR